METKSFHNASGSHGRIYDQLRATVIIDFANDKADKETDRVSQKEARAEERNGERGDNFRSTSHAQTKEIVRKTGLKETAEDIIRYRYLGEDEATVLDLTTQGKG